ncbi:hypothetical protein GCM10020254_87350 [Streptomyces goshikiensis]
MTLIEPGLSVRDGFAEGPLADAALSRAARTAQLLDELEEQAPTMTDGQLRDGVYRALRRFTQDQPPACQVDSFTDRPRRIGHVRPADRSPVLAGKPTARQACPASGPARRDGPRGRGVTVWNAAARSRPTPPREP